METPNRNIATQELLRYFAYAHLPEHLQAISAPCCALAIRMCEELADSRELTVGLRKLLEAKDCFVRARLPPAAGLQRRDSGALAAYDDAVDAREADAGAGEEGG